MWDFSFISQMKETQSFLLPSGRQIGYAEYGRYPNRAGLNPDSNYGPVCKVLYCHGHPGCRTDARAADRSALENNMHVLAIDRPGFGISQYHKGRTISCWPMTDVLPVVEAIGWKSEKFVVVGVSGGAAYALACAAKIPDKVLACVVVCGLGLACLFNKDPAVSKMYRVYFKIAKYLPDKLLPALGVIAVRPFTGKRCRKTISKRYNSLMPLEDITEAEREQELQWLVDSTEEALRPGPKGAMQDAKLLAGKWGFSLESVSSPVLWFHGENDKVIPPTVGAGTANMITGCIFKQTCKRHTL